MAAVKLAPGEQAAIRKLIEEDVPELSQDEEDAIDEAFATDGEAFPSGGTTPDPVLRRNASSSRVGVRWNRRTDTTWSTRRKN